MRMYLMHAWEMLSVCPHVSTRVQPDGLFNDAVIITDYKASTGMTTSEKSCFNIKELYFASKIYLSVFHS